MAGQVAIVCDAVLSRTQGSRHPKKNVHTGNAKPHGCFAFILQPFSHAATQIPASIEQLKEQIKKAPAPSSSRHLLPREVGGRVWKFVAVYCRCLIISCF